MLEDYDIPFTGMNEENLRDKVMNEGNPIYLNNYYDEPDVDDYDDWD